MMMMMRCKIAVPKPIRRTDGKVKVRYDGACNYPLPSGLTSSEHEQEEERKEREASVD